MKKENLILIFFFVVMSVAFLAVLGIQQFIPQTKVDHMFGQKTQVVNELAIVDSNYSSIVNVSEVLNLNGDKLADLYLVRMDTSYFYMELYVAITPEGEVYAIDKVAQTKDETSTSYLPQVRSYLLKYYSGVERDDVKNIDGAAGATTIQVSRSQIKSAIMQVLIFHGGDPIDYIEELFNGEYTLNQTTEGAVTIYDVTFGGNDYLVYKTKGSGTFASGDNVNTGEITILVAIDENGIVTHVSMPDDLYGHTKGSYYTATLAFLNQMINQDITNAIPDSTTGPTSELNTDGSQYLVHNLLVDIQEARS